jgi:hypothetical protein
MKHFPIFLACCVVTAACEHPGEGAKAERGYARGKIVIAAIDSFQRARGDWPDSLPELLPDFADSSALVVPSAPQERYPFEFGHEGDGYRLTFTYVGPGMNHCTYASDTKNWDCHGYY